MDWDLEKHETKMTELKLMMWTLTNSPEKKVVIMLVSLD